MLGSCMTSEIRHELMRPYNTFGWNLEILKYLRLRSDYWSFLQLETWPSTTSMLQGIARMVAAFRYRDGAYLVLECPSNSFLSFVCHDRFSIWQLKDCVPTLKLLNLMALTCQLLYWKDTNWIPPTRGLNVDEFFLPLEQGWKNLQPQSQTVRFVCFASVLHVLLCKLQFFVHLPMQRFGGMLIKETCTICCVPWASFRRPVDKNDGKTLIGRMNTCEFATLVIKMTRCCLLLSWKNQLLTPGKDVCKDEDSSECLGERFCKWNAASCHGSS